MEKQVPQNFENSVFESKASFQETESKQNNNINFLKTEMEINNSYHNSSLLLEVINGKVQNSTHSGLPCEYTNHKKVTDLNIDNITLNRNERTIFDDAEYYSKNYTYKLLPISFENVNEMIIHSEHNYCNLSLSSESDAEEDCSRTMDYKQVKEKNYKKRKSKLKEDIINQNLMKPKLVNEKNLISITMKDNNLEKSVLHNSNLKNDFSFYPLDLSAPLVQDEKTENKEGECINMKLSEKNVMVINSSKNDISTNKHEWEETIKEKDNYSAQFDSDKENKNLNKNLIEVTITRSDAKNNYQPCDSFLNDIARLVPKIIGKNCNEIDILDHTCDSYLNFENHRLYYVISESTWQLFQNANERVILTNDRSLGQPVQKQEKNERPTYLIFDQFSLAKCLADYCRKIGGCFEYKFIEGENEGMINASEKFFQEKKVRNEEYNLIDIKNLANSVLNKSDEVPFCEKSKDLIDDKNCSRKNDLKKINLENLCESTKQFNKDFSENEEIQLKKECEEKKLCPILIKQDVEYDKASEEAKIKESVKEILDSKINTEKPVKMNLSEKGVINTDKIEECKELKVNEINKFIDKAEVIEIQDGGKKKKNRTKQSSKNKVQAEKSLKISKEKPVINKEKRVGRSSNFSLSASVVSPQIRTRKSLHLRRKTLGELNDKNLKKSKTMEEKLSMKTRLRSAGEAETEKAEFGKTVTSQKKSDSNTFNTSKKEIKRKHCVLESFRKSTCKNNKVMRITGECSAAVLVKEEKRRTRSETSSLNVKSQNHNGSRKNKNLKNNLTESKSAKKKNCGKSNEVFSKNPILKVTKRANRKVQDSKIIKSERKCLRNKNRNEAATKSRLKNAKNSSQGTLKERRKRKKDLEKNPTNVLSKRARRH